MPHVNPALLLEDYGVTTFDDFRELKESARIEFLRRLKSSVDHQARRELKRTLEIVEKEPGLKTFYNVKRIGRQKWQNIPSRVFARKLAFFTSRSVICFPFNEVNFRNGQDLEVLLTLLCDTRPFVKEGYITIVPTDRRDPYLRRVLKQLMPANFQLTKLVDHFEENFYDTHHRNVWLPHFSDMSDEHVVTARKEHRRLHEMLESRLEKDLMNGKFDENRFVEELSLIHNYLMKLAAIRHNTTDAIRKLCIWRLMFLGMSAFAGILLVPYSTVAAAVASVVGTENLQNIVREVLKEMERRREPAANDFYLFWRVNHHGDLCSLRILLEDLSGKLERGESS